MNKKITSQLKWGIRVIKGHRCNLTKMESLVNKIPNPHRLKSNSEEAKTGTNPLFKAFLASSLVFVFARLISRISLLALLTSSIMTASSSGGAIISWGKRIPFILPHFLTGSSRLWVRSSFVQDFFFFRLVLSQLSIDVLVSTSSFNLASSSHFSRSLTARSANLTPAV